MVFVFDCATKSASPSAKAGACLRSVRHNRPHPYPLLPPSTTRPFTSASSSGRGQFTPSLLHQHRAGRYDGNVCRLSVERRQGRTGSFAHHGAVDASHERALNICSRHTRDELRRLFSSLQHGAPPFCRSNLPRPMAPGLEIGAESNKKNYEAKTNGCQAAEPSGAQRFRPHLIPRQPLPNIWPLLDLLIVLAPPHPPHEPPDRSRLRSGSLANSSPSMNATPPAGVSKLSTCVSTSLPSGSA